MKSAWNSALLGDAVQAVLTGPFGSILHKSDYEEDGVPLVNPANIVDEQIALDGIKLVGFQKAKSLKSYELQVGDIVIGRRGEIGRCAVVTNEQAGWLCGTGSFIIRPGISFDPRFLATMLRSPACVANLVKAAAGATMPNLSNGSLSDLSIVVPPLEEQQRIVAVLNKAFAGIATATANAEKNLTNARALFDSYLQSILVKRGDGWVDRSIADIADTSLGKMLDKQKNKGELQPYLRNINVRWFQFDLKDLLQMRFEESEEDRYSIKKGDVVICEGGYPGRAAIWQSEESIYYQKALHRVRFKNSLMGRWFVYILYYADSVGDLKMHFTGSGIQHFTGQALKRFSIPVPRSDDLPELISGLDLVFHKTNLAIATYERKISALSELKQSLLQKAFAGELT